MMLHRMRAEQLWNGLYIILEKKKTLLLFQIDRTANFNFIFTSFYQSFQKF